MLSLKTQIEHRPVNNFLEFAQVISGSKLFIGNQSCPFSAAKGSKVNRLREVYWRTPNVIQGLHYKITFCGVMTIEKVNYEW
jgi:hypothetical protein